MARGSMDDLQAFLIVARERSFTRAAAKMGITEAGERLLKTVGLHFEQIEAELSALSDFRDRPAGTIRISCGDSVVQTIFRPMLKPFLRAYPDIRAELSISNGFVDIVEQGLDAGVRLGEALSKDMVAVRIGPDWRFTVVATPEYFERRDPPLAPQDLTNHQCINLRLTTAGGLYAWEFRKDGRDINVRVDGQLIFNSILPVLGAALDGHGLAYVPEYMARSHIERGELTEVLGDWSITWQGYHLYYPNRRHPSPAFAALVDALRYRA
jgi:DNA-binding transcriptional LysR family regulator